MNKILLPKFVQSFATCILFIFPKTYLVISQITQLTPINNEPEIY